MEFVSLKEAHLDDALDLVARAYRLQREHVPDLPERHEDPASYSSRLTHIIRENPGVAATDDGRLVGFLVGYTRLEQFKGTLPGIYVPEWGHAAVGEYRAETYLHMYEHLSGPWVADGNVSQALSVFSIDGEVMDTWFQNGFGLVVVDAVRSLAPVLGRLNDDITVREATMDDVGALLSLMREFEAYISGPPIFLAGKPETRESIEDWLAQPGRAWFMAFADGKPVAYIRCMTSAENACYIVRDPETVAISGAYTKRHLWRTGIASTLLTHVVDWGNERGAMRLSVDFEAQNIYGSRFWLKHFHPVCYSLHRRIDERVLDRGN